jgi:hypothetical protein
MSMRGRWHTRFFRFFESATQESIPVAPVRFYDDFFALDTLYWTAKDTSVAGNTTPVLVADGDNGQLTLLLDATSEKQESGYFWNDNRPFKLDHGPNFEIYCTPSVLPTGQSEIYFGLAGDYVEGPIAEADAGPAQHLFFCMDGSGAVTIHTDDGTTDNNAVATGVTLTAGTFAVFRIDATDPTNILFYINGSRVASGTTFSANATPTLALQPFLICHKEAGTGLGTLLVDYVRVWSDRA